MLNIARALAQAARSINAAFSPPTTTGKMDY